MVVLGIADTDSSDSVFHIQEKETMSELKGMYLYY
jgi:hypothetical protein